MTSPSSPRAGRSTVSAAGEPLDFVSVIRKALTYLDPPGDDPHAVGGPLVAPAVATLRSALNPAGGADRPQLFDPLSEEVGRFVARWVAPEQRVDAVDDTFRLLQLAREYPWAASPNVEQVDSADGVTARPEAAPHTLADCRIAIEDHIGQAVPQSERGGLTPEAVKKAIRLVTDNDSYDLDYVKECARLANDVLAALASPAHPDEE